MMINGDKKIVGFTAGNFDIIHPGYVYTFQTAKKHCDYFMVFLQNDPSLDRANKYKPVVPRAERYNTLMELESVDAVYTYQTEDELYKLIQFFKPDVRILGEDYIGKRFTGDDLPPKIIYTSRAHGWSTTKLKNDIAIQTLKDNPELILTQPDLLDKIKQLKYDGDE
jgi:glycerol-3-phosphate cytidylyltransferase